jgi:transposase InsO family protein
VLCTNNGGEFMVAEFAVYCANEGIQRHFSAPYTPQQNGVVERRNQTVVATAHALLKQRGMPAIYWGEAVMTVIHLLNRSPTKALDGKTPYEAWHGAQAGGEPPPHLPLSCLCQGAQPRRQAR